MRRAATAIALLVALSGTPAAADVAHLEGGPSNLCVVTTRHAISDRKAIRRCEAPADAVVTRSRKQDKRYTWVGWPA